MNFSILKPLLIDECFSNVLYLNYIAKVLFINVFRFIWKIYLWIKCFAGHTETK